MKMILVLSSLVLSFGAHAATLSNAQARLQVQRLLFRNDTPKTEFFEIKGANGAEPCSIIIRKTRFGVYVVVKNSEGAFETGLTNSEYTTQNLKFEMTPGQVSFSRLGVTGINERGEDYGNESAVLSFDQTANGELHISDLVVTFEPLEYNEDANHNAVYTSSGPVHTAQCSAL